MSSGAATVRQWVRDVQRFADDWPAEGADVLADAVERQLRADTGGDGRFSRDRSGGRATVEVDAGRGQADVTGAGSMGTWAILEHGTRSHDVAAAEGRALSTPHGPRRSVRVSGVRPRETWTRGVDDGMSDLERDGAAAWSKVGA